METLRIFSDSPFDDAAVNLLRDGVAPHELLLPQTRVTSVLAQPEPDPQFPLADIAFGQPDIASIRGSDRLKWLQISSAGFTRYDTPEFREFAASRGLVVTNSSSVYAAACAEHVHPTDRSSGHAFARRQFLRAAKTWSSSGLAALPTSS